ncbi:surface antigen BspA-like [Trichomonas vaginalis G3]|uniref:Surface antigen BspA-like n=1 Tax=Trichomonas vaginalis (strain ATCC PRA-98 / G3) TaxID=412133 RepID=A2EMR5_TRIV3|nr:surface antigen family [Trichomonas vaginalis G3]EAY06061.1 surface antigen BspA-like [Trichomonas vaginalis G3]KAI5536575.1 surface antigen family [Trichomonas vaginalis G3]|eukprot:XP_001318284.1 surface antigen BspA-like [Trichomonas vaginalis G3]
MISLLFLFISSKDSYKIDVVNNVAQLSASKGAVYTGEITIPSKVDHNSKSYVVGILRKSLFENSTITSITLPNSITEIKQNCFANCKKLKTVNLKALKLNSIRARTFCSCDSLVAVILPTTVKTIEDYSFYNCYNLEAIDTENIPIVSIGNYSFTNCRKLTEIVVNNKKFSYLGDYCFANTSLTSFNFQDNLTHLGIGAFSHTKLRNFEISDTLLTEIADHAFEYCQITELLLPPSINSIGESAFEGNSGIKNVDISYTCVYTIKSAAFKNCHSLSSFNPSILTQYIGDFVFEATNLSEFTVSESYRHFGSYCFKSCQNLIKANFYEMMFDNIPEGLFYNCTKFQVIQFARRYFEIKAHAFEFTAIEHIRFPNSIIGIGDYAFAHCHSMLTVDISNIDYSLTGTHIFYDCPKVNLVLFSEDDIVLPPYLLAGTSLEIFNPSRNILGIGEGCFMNCKKLKEVNLLRTVMTNISDYAFFGCNISKILLPPSISLIGYMALGNGTVNSVVYYGQNMPFFGYSTKFGSVTVNFGYQSDVFCGDKVRYEHLNQVGENGEKMPEDQSLVGFFLKFIALVMLIIFVTYMVNKHGLEYYLGFFEHNNRRLIIG